MKRATKFGLVWLIAAGVGGFWYLRTRPKDYEQAFRDYQNGVLPPIPGPYIPEGKPSDLKFELVDLGIGEAVDMSEDGDVLYKWYGDQPVRTKFKDIDGFEQVSLDVNHPTWRVRRANGTIQDFPNAQRVFLTKSGKAISVDNFGGEFKIACNGKVIVKGAEAKSKYGVIVEPWNEQNRITDDGIFSYDFDSNCSFDSSMNLIPIPRNDLGGAFFDKSSTELGTAGMRGSIPKFKWTEPKYTLCVRKGSNIREVDLPSQIGNPLITTSKNRIFVYGSLVDRGHPFAYDGKEFKEQPIPSSVINIHWFVSNSHDDQMFFVDETKVTSLESKEFAHYPRWLAVSGGMTYDLEAILANLGLKYGPRQEDFNGCIYPSIDEHGDFMATGCKDSDYHLFLVKRVK